MVVERITLMPASALPALVVGTGFGCRIQVPALRAAGFEVVGLVGTDAKRTQERAELNSVPKGFADLDEAIARTGAVAVTIATPPSTHKALTLTAIARGCHVICEKPFAMSAAEGQAMLSAAKAAGIVHLIGHEFRWSPERALIARLVADGAVGKPKFATFTSFSPYIAGPNVDMPSWWFDMEWGGGWLGAAGSHLIDWIRTILGEIESLSAALSVLAAREAEADDTYAFRFRGATGVDGIVQQSAATWGPPLDVVRVAGPQGTVWIEGRDVWLADREGSRQVALPEELRLPPLPPVSTDPRQKSPKWQMLVGVELPGYVRLCEAFRDLINGRKPSAAVAIPTFADGLASMQVLDAIRASDASGGALVKIKPSA